MSTRDTSAKADPVIESFDQLVAPMIGGEKPKADWRIGTEHEKLVFKRDDRRAPSYDEMGGIRDILMSLARVRLGAGRGRREGHRHARAMTGRSAWNLPGSWNCRARRWKTCTKPARKPGRHLDQVKRVGEACDVGFLGLGMWPDKTRAELPMMPKGRYEIMRRHMPRVGTLGLDMMLRTCTIQVNLDYSSEADMAQKFRTGLALQPLATALFANSPFTEGKPNGYLSYRSHIWSDTDPHRTGMLPFVFEDGFGYERWVGVHARRADVFRLPRRQVYRRRRTQLPRLPEGQAARAARRASDSRPTGGTICPPPSPKCG